MELNQIVAGVPNKMHAAVAHFQDDLKKLRTGRAHAGMLEGVTVTAYGAQMLLNQVATVMAPEAQLLQVTPFDPNNLQAIASAIRDNQTLGLNPTDDGRVVRVPIPPLTEERRRDLTKMVGQKLEDCMVSLRNIRHEAMDTITRSKKDKQIGEDDAKRLERQVDEALGVARSEAETAARAKEQEIITL